MPLSPEYEATFAQLAEEPGPALNELSPADGREMYRAMRPVNPDIQVGHIADQNIPGPAGDLPIRIYTPATNGPFPVVVNFHGGGWVIGDLETSDAACRDLCNTANCVVVSVDYRLAPEHIFPAAVDDAYAATEWVAANMASLNGNGKLAVTGESAGGNLAAVVSLLARDAIARDSRGPKIDFQLLLYPVVDTDFNRQSYKDNGEGYLLTTDSMVYFWDHYCPTNLRSDPRATPLNAPSLANLPPALVVTAEFDPLRDEGAAYVEALAAAGNQAELACYDGMVHDFFATAQLFKSSRAGFEATCKTLQAALT